MISQKLAAVESSLDLLKEKMKSLQLFKSNTESRLTTVQSRCSVLSGNSFSQQKENISNIDSLLAQSHLFAASLKRVDGTALANIKKLEQCMGEAMQEHQGRFMEIEERLVGMLSQKQKILRNIALQTQNNAHSIKGLQEWITTDHNRGKSLAVFESALRDRLQTQQKNNDMKLAAIEEKVRYYQGLHESAATHRKRWAQQREQIEGEVGVLRKQLKRKMAEIQERVEQTAKKSMQVHNKSLATTGKVEQSTEKIEKLTKQLETHRDNFQSKIQLQINTLKQTINQNLSKTNEKQPTKTQRREQEKTVQYYEQRQVIAAPNSRERMRNELIKTNKYDQYPKDEGRGQDTFFTDKKPLPPKKNLFSPAEIQQKPYSTQKNRSGGIRGLLQKSKEKQSRRPQTLSRQKSSGKGLPPVREDPFARKKNTESVSKRQEANEEQEQIVYEVDEEGYLMDQEGNYLLNEHEEMIRLSPEEIQQYLEEGEEY